MLVEMMTTPRSCIEQARTWTEINHLARPWKDAGPRDIIVVGDLGALRTALDVAGIAHTLRTRVIVTPRMYRIDRLVIGGRVTARRVGDVGRMVEIATDLGVLVALDDDGASPSR